MGYKIIRDVIYGDIYFPEKFLKLIDTPEFQRLHRVKQLSTAYMLFPSAVHTRFSHSIGTYYVMGKLLTHFEEILRKMGIPITEDEKNLALCAALLHDIGHGPFSHAFEKAFPDEIQIDDHEKWSINIINSESSSINKVLKEHFGEQFPQKVSWVIEKNFETILKECNLERINIFKIISLLISSQLDADRMDYLLRDAYFTSVTNGRYDLDRLIRSLDIDIKDNQICICVNEKYISTLEQYVLARYHMYKEIYLHPIKCEMESIVRKIYYRLYELTKEGRKEYIDVLPETLKKIFRNEKINIKEYIDLDDTVVTALINKFINNSDYILSTLCNDFINRHKYKRLNLFNNKEADINFFKNKLNDVLSKEGKDPILNYENEYFWIESNMYVEICKNGKGIGKNILIRKSNGTLINISEVSNVINKQNTASEGVRNKNDKENTRIMAFINEDLFKNKYNGMLEKLNELTKAFENRNHIEIENKYIIEDSKIFNSMFDTIKYFDPDYTIKCLTKNPVCQFDYYYDTKDNSLYKSNRTLRIREIENEKIITIKKPIEYEDSSNSQRYEYEEHIENNALYENKAFILKHLPELKESIDEKNLINSMLIKNERQKFLIEKGEVRFEMVFDDVKFLNGIEKQTILKEDYEIEIELKSDYSHRVCLNELTNYIENELKIKSSSKSKYKRGMDVLENII